MMQYPYCEIPQEKEKIMQYPYCEIPQEKEKIMQYPYCDIPRKTETTSRYPHCEIPKKTAERISSAGGVSSISIEFWQITRLPYRSNPSVEIQSSAHAVHTLGPPADS